MTDTARAPMSPREHGSRLLHVVDRIASRPLVAVVAVGVDAGWVAASLVTGFPSHAEQVFQSLVAALTLAMVFVIQHTQAREQVATQRKLDEILRALPAASNALIAFEEASDDELQLAQNSHRRLRQQAVESDLAAPEPGSRAAAVEPD